MIGAVMIRVVAVIGGDDQQIVTADARQNVGQPPVEFHQRPRVTFGIAPMAVQRVEIDEIGEQEPVKRRIQQLRRPVDAVRVAFRLERLRHAFSGVDVADFADGQAVEARLLQPVHHRRRRRFQRIVAAVGRALKRSGLSDVRPRYDASDAMRRVQRHPSRRFAGGVQLLQRDHVFVRGDLKHAVGGRVDDPRPRAHLPFAQFGDNLRAGRRFVADDRAAGRRFEGADQFRGETVRIRLKRGVDAQAHQFPMSGHRVFSGRYLRHLAVAGARIRHRGYARERRDKAEPELGHMGQRKPLHAAGDMAERVGAAVAERVRVGKLADADAVEHDQRDTTKCHDSGLSFLTSSVGARP